MKDFTRSKAIKKKNTIHLEFSSEKQSRSFEQFLGFRTQQTFNKL